MATTVNLKPILDVPNWQLMTPAPIVSVAGSLFIPSNDRFQRAMYIYNNTTHYLYNPETDGYVQIKASGIAGTFAAGTAGFWHPSGPTGTISAATSTTITTNLTLNVLLEGYTIRITGGTGAGQDRVIDYNVLGANTVITVTSAWTITPDATSTFVIYSGRYWFFNPGSSGVGFMYYDWATDAWVSRSVTGLPNWGTSGGLTGTPSTYETYVTVSAPDIVSATTVGKTGKTWTASQWVNSQVRITEGTGAGQVRTITANTGTTLTVATWTVNPDATSVFVIEPNDDFLYLIGNNAVTLYRYSISGNTWSTITPGVARSAAPGAGCSWEWAFNVPSTYWTNENDYLSGRYIYSFRGAATSTLHRYNIASNAWEVMNYQPLMETFTSGSAGDYYRGSIFMVKDATNRFYQYSVVANRLRSLPSLPYPNSTVREGKKLFVSVYTDGAVSIPFVYYQSQSLTNIWRLLVQP